jgi:hypothetical protein
MNFTQDDIDAIAKRPGYKIKTVSKKLGTHVGLPEKKTQKRGDGYDNQLEADFAQHLECLKRSGEILDWHYSPIKLRESDSAAGITWYNPDFFAIENDRTLTIYECKGFMRDDANVKLKVGATLFKWLGRFKLVRKRKKADGGGFDITDVRSDADWLAEHVLIKTPIKKKGAIG